MTLLNDRKSTNSKPLGCLSVTPLRFVSVCLCMALLLYIPDSAAFDPWQCEMPSSGKAEERTTNLRFDSPTWTLCIVNATAEGIEYAHRWGPDPYEWHILPPGGHRMHYCNPKIATCILPVHVKFTTQYQGATDYREQSLIPVEQGSGCLKCGLTNVFYFERYPEYIILH